MIPSTRYALFSKPSFPQQPLLPFALGHEPAHALLCEDFLTFKHTQSRRGVIYSEIHRSQYDDVLRVVAFLSQDIESPRV
jgi:hypothetical protein